MGVLTTFALDWLYLPGTAGALVPGAYRAPLVVLSYLVAVAGATLALRIASAQALMRAANHRHVVLMASTLALGGAIWGMHFIGMLAFELCAQVRYDPLITVASSLPAFLAAAVALRTLAREHLSPRQRLVAGVWMGAGIGAMHYSGMLAMDMAPDLRFVPELLALSVVGAVTLSALGLWVREAVEALGGWVARMNHLVGGLVMGAAITVMHYVGMASARFVGVAETAAPVPANNQLLIAWFIVAGSVGLIGAVAAGEMMLRLRLMLNRLRLRERELRIIFQHALDAIVTTDDQHRVMSVNQTFQGMFGYAPDQVLGRDVRSIVPDWPEAADPLLDEAVQAGTAPGHIEGHEVESRVQEVQARRADGSLIPLRLSLVHVWESGQALRVAFLMDISDIKRRQALAEHAANHDPLTGLLNRRGFDLALEQFRQALSDADEIWALLFVDLDGFKAINDRLGHAAGDEVLEVTARRLQHSVRHSDLVARLGGDEFIVLLRGVHAPEVALRVGGKMLESVGGPIRLTTGENTAVHCSVGIAHAPASQWADPGTLIALADAAMYDAKKAGKGCIRSAADAASA